MRRPRFIEVKPCHSAKKNFSKKQIEECRELESQAASAEDRAFWRQAVGRWEEQLRQAQRGKFF
jgi:hypothetical protein